jgi:predicted branched-subunit amino acid permease
MPFRIQHPAYTAGIKDSSPTWFGVGAWGLVVGVAMIKAGLTLWQAIGMTLIVFAGSAQLAALPLIAAQAPLWVIFVTAIVVNLRFLIFSAIVAPRFAHLSAIRRVYLGFFTGDVTVALFTQKYPDMAANVAEQKEQTAYLHGLVIPNWLAWQIGTIIGIVLGSQIPTSWSLGFAGTLAILCVMLPLVMNKPALLGVFVAGVVAIFLYSFPYKLGLLIAVIVGMASAMLLEEILERRHAPNQDKLGERDE